MRACGSGTLNDANTSDVIVPVSLPCLIHIMFDIINLNNASDDFNIEVKAGVAESERVVCWVNLTSDGANITLDNDTGTPQVIHIERLSLANIIVWTGEQVIVELTRNDAADRDVPYGWAISI